MSKLCDKYFKAVMNLQLAETNININRYNKGDTRAYTYNRIIPIWDDQT